MRVKSFFSVLLLPLFFMGLTAGVSAGDTEFDFSKAKTYDATATPLSVVSIYGGFDNEYKGKILYTPMAGTTFKGPVVDTDGNVIEQGDVLVQMDTEFRDAQVAQAKATITEDLAALNTAKVKYERYQQIQKAGQGAVSAQDFLETKNGYLTALAQLEADKAALILAEKLRSICTFYAAFDGIVDKVYMPSGYVGTFGNPTLDVSQLVPMGINVKMSRQEATALSTDTTIIIYPLVGDQPVEPFRGVGRLIDDGVQLIVKNTIMSSDYKEINGKKVKVVNDLSTVAPFRLHKLYKKGDQLSVNEKCIMKDDKGEYVYEDASVTPDTIGEGIKPLMKIKKTYIKTANRVNPIQPGVNYILLTDDGGLSIRDQLLFADDCKDIKEGDEVYYQKIRYLFMPGDPVKVVIGGKPLPADTKINQ